MDENKIVNRVANSGLVTIDPETFYTPGTRFEIDLKNNLFKGLILREKDFRDFIGTHNWEQYKNGLVAVHCSADAVIPTWAFMLVASKLQNIAGVIYYGTPQAMETHLMTENIKSLKVEEFSGKRVVVKGCGDLEISPGAYVEITRLLAPVVKSLMFGEPCSTVPVLKN